MKANFITLTGILTVALIAGGTVNAEANDLNGVRFSENYADQGVSMELKGAGLKSMVFFKAFAAGYYKGEDVDSNALGEFPKRIEVEYFVNIPARKLQNFTIDVMKDNVTEQEFVAITEQVKAMGEYFVDLKAGDRFSLTYIPGSGTEFAHNNEITGVIEGSEFAKALFSVWIGERPFDKKLKKKIIGQDEVDGKPIKQLVYNQRLER